MEHHYIKARLAFFPGFIPIILSFPTPMGSAGFMIPQTPERGGATAEKCMN